MHVQQFSLVHKKSVFFKKIDRTSVFIDSFDNAAVIVGAEVSNAVQHIRITAHWAVAINAKPLRNTLATELVIAPLRGIVHLIRVANGTFLARAVPMALLTNNFITICEKGLARAWYL